MSTLDVFDGESLSSWMARINVLSGYVDEQLEFFDRAASFREVSLFDPDDVKKNVELEAFIKRHGFDAEAVCNRFPWPQDPISSVRYRRSYCYLCMEEGIVQTKWLVMKLDWRKTLQPFCRKHQCLLRDAPIDEGVSNSLGLEIFKWHHSNDRRYDRYDADLLSNSSFLEIAAHVQSKYLELRDLHPGEVCKIDGFILALMRAMLMPPMIFCFNNVDIYGYRGPDCFPKHASSLFVQFYSEVYRVSCSARARAYYLCGLLLGWVVEADAERARGRDYYIAVSAEQIWRKISISGRLSDLLRRELNLHSSRVLSVNDLHGFQYLR